jgi:hypothetical protein
MPRPRTHQTERQYEIELMVADANAAQFGLRVPMTEVVSDPVKSALLDLTRRMCTLVHRPAVVYLHGEAPCVGVLLLRTPRPDGTAYAIALKTHEPIVRPDTHAIKLLDDGFGPAPDDHLDGWRFTTAFTGLLRLLEREIRQLLKGDDWNWNDGSDPSASPADEEDWHPRTMLARVRRMRREVRRAITVEEVHQL